MIEIVLRGISLWVHDNEALSNAIRRDKDFFEAEILDYLRQNFPKQRTILDIGANIGNHSVYFANFLNYDTIIAFEPIKENFELLKINMAEYKSIGLANIAVSDKSIPLFMNFHNENYGASAVNSDGERQVSAISIDSIMLREVSLMKIDVEGHEPFVLDGANETIYRCKPLILIEDWNKEYSKYLPKEYYLNKGWDNHHTYLYEWGDIYA